MGNDMFTKFDEMFDVAGLAKDIADITSNAPTERVKVPHGDYEVSIAKLELGTNEFEGENFGFPMIKVWFNVLDGEYKGNYIYWNTTINGKGDAFKINNIKKLMDSLETGIPVSFENFAQFGSLLTEVFEAVTDPTAEYQLAFGENNKGFNTYTIVQRFQTN